MAPTPAGWLGIASHLAQLQSRPTCTCPGANCPRLDQGDCSGWLECYDMDCQANAYEALLRAFSVHAEDWWLGVYWWLWRTDPSEGRLM
jgi:hypothetical protein